MSCELARVAEYCEVDVTDVRTEAPYELMCTVVRQKFGRSSPDRDKDKVRSAYLDTILVDDKVLYQNTRMERDMFEFLAYLVWVWIEGHDDARLTREDTTRKSDGGNRCKLAIRQALVVVLVAKKTGDSVTDLAGRFLLDPVTVDRYVKDYDKMLNEILPTADSIEEIIGAVYDERARRTTSCLDAGDEAADPADPENAGPDPQDAGDEAADPADPENAGPDPPDAGDEAADPADPERSGPDPYLVDIPPWQILNRAVALSYMQTPPPVGITGLPVSEGPTLPTFHPGPDLCVTDGPPNTAAYVLIDGTHVRIESSSDREWNRLTYAGKVKCHSYNKNYYVDPGGLYIGKSPAVPGSMHDFRLLKENLPKFGWLTKIMLRNDLPEWARPNIVVDKGYVGIDKLLPGARIWIPVKLGAGSDEGGELSQKDLDHNREVAQVRYMVEVAVGRIKQYGVMSGPYRGTPEQYDKDTNILTGLVNLKTLWPHVKAAHADTIRRVTAWRGRG